MKITITKERLTTDGRKVSFTNVLITETTADILQTLLLTEEETRHLVGELQKTLRRSS